MRADGWKKVHHPAHIERVTTRLQQHLETGQPWEDTFPLRGKDGQYRWFLSRAIPIRDESGQVIRWFGTNTDVTEQRRLQDALEDNDRRKDEFLAMLAHELRNPVAPIVSAAEALEGLLSPDGKESTLSDPLFIPQAEQGLPQIDGAVLPVISAANWVRLTEPWLANAHRAGGRSAA